MTKRHWNYSHFMMLLQPRLNQKLSFFSNRLSSLRENKAADMAQAKAGDDYEFEKATVPVRYIRIQTLGTWANIGNIHIAELEFYGAKVTP